MDSKKIGQGSGAEAARLLARHPLYLPLSVQLRGAVLTESIATEQGPDPDALARELTEIADLLRGHPVLAAKATTETLLWRMRGNAALPPPPRLLPVVRNLAEQGHLAAELIAVLLVRLTGPKAGWDAEWRGMLDSLRRSDDLAVRQDAWSVTPPP
jgi:hypothetical protein